MGHYIYEYPRPGLTSDIVLFRYFINELQILLIERKDSPFAGAWALPGGFVSDGETAEIAAKRELYEETNILDIDLTQVYTETAPGRDPRGWTISVIFAGFVNSNIQPIAGDDASSVRWYTINELPEMAFDHNRVFNCIFAHVKELLVFKVFGYQVLKSRFKLQELKGLYAQILDEKKDVEKYISKLIDNAVISENNSYFSFNMDNVNNKLLNGW